MVSRLAWRRLVTAAGIYGAAVFGFLGTVVAARSLGPHDFGLLAIVLAAAGFFLLLLDFTTGDAVVKYGVRYATQEDWGRLRRLLSVVARVQSAGAVLGAAGIAALAPLSGSVFGAGSLTTPFLVAALLPLVGMPQGISNAVMLVRGRYEFHGILLSVAMIARFAAMAVGAQYGVTETVVGLVLGQALAASINVAIAWRAYSAYPRAAARPLAEDAPAIRRFVVLSTIGTGLDALRNLFPSLLLGIVTTPSQVAFFRAAQAPQAGFAVLSAPVRVILLTEQTHDVERGNLRRVTRMLRRYVTGAAALMLLIVPPLLWLMPDLVRIVYGGAFEQATDPARLILLAAALQVVLGWTKPLPISIGRPTLRIVAGSCEIAALVPCLLVFGALWDATGAAAAVLAGVGAFTLAWLVLLVRLRRTGLAAPPGAGEAALP